MPKKGTRKPSLSSLSQRCRDQSYVQRMNTEEVQSADVKISFYCKSRFFLLLWSFKLNTSISLIHCFVQTRCHSNGNRSVPCQRETAQRSMWTLKGSQSSTRLRILRISNGFSTISCRISKRQPVSCILRFLSRIRYSKSSQSSYRNRPDIQEVVDLQRMHYHDDLNPKDSKFPRSTLRMKIMDLLCAQL